MILIFLRIFVNDRQKSIVGQATNNGKKNGDWQRFRKNINSVAQNFMKPALMILIFLRIFVNDRQKSIVGQATNNGIFKKIQ